LSHVQTIFNESLAREVERITNKVEEVSRGDGVDARVRKGRNKMIGLARSTREDQRHL
jgi:hypothetical protein